MLYKSYLNSFFKKIAGATEVKDKYKELAGDRRLCSARKHPLVTCATDLGMTLSLLFLLLEQLKL